MNGYYIILYEICIVFENTTDVDYFAKIKFYRTWNLEIFI